MAATHRFSGNGRHDTRAALLAFVAAACWAVSVSASISGFTDFSQYPDGSTYGAGTHAPGDNVFTAPTTDGEMDIRVQPLDTGGTTTFGTATIGGFTEPAFGWLSTTPKPATLSNLRLDFDLLSVWGPQTTLSANLLFANFGGVNNLVINDTELVFEDFATLPTTIDDIEIGVTLEEEPYPGAQRGYLSVYAPFSRLQRFEIGGQELGIADVSFFGVGGFFGDYDGSGLVEQADLDLVLLNWGHDTDTLGPPPGWDLLYLHDGLIDQNELDAVLLNWANLTSPTGGSPAAVPEPIGTAQLVATTVFLADRRRDTLGR